jgi:hypothetical protein
MYMEREALLPLEAKGGLPDENRPALSHYFRPDHDASVRRAET